MRDGTPPPSSFSPDWVEWPRRCTVPYPANLETRLEIPIFNGVSTIPSSRVEGPFQGNFRLPNCRRIFIVLPFIVYLLLFIFPLVLFPLYSRILIEILKIIINILRFFSLRVSNGALNSLDLFSSFSCYYYFYRCVIIFAEKILPSQYLKCRFFFLCFKWYLKFPRFVLIVFVLLLLLSLNYVIIFAETRKNILISKMSIPRFFSIRFKRYLKFPRFILPLLLLSLYYDIYRKKIIPSQYLRCRFFAFPLYASSAISNSLELFSSCHLITL